MTLFAASLLTGRFRRVLCKVVPACESGDLMNDPGSFLEVAGAPVYPTTFRGTLISKAKSARTPNAEENKDD